MTTPFKPLGYFCLYKSGIGPKGVSFTSSSGGSSDFSVDWLTMLVVLVMLFVMEVVMSFSVVVVMEGPEGALDDEPELNGAGLNVLRAVVVVVVV